MVLTRNPHETPDCLDVRIGFARLDESDLQSDRALLSSDENARAARFVQDVHRCRFIAARAFLRRMLADTVGIPPARLTFGYESKGRPYLNGSARQPALSLSHCDDVAVAVVSWVGPLGVDLEYIRPLDDCGVIAEQIMHPRELMVFQQLPASARINAFYQLWTRKEALLKASGAGFFAEPRDFGVGFAAALDDGGFDVDGTHCLVRDIKAPAGFAAALCAPAAARLVEEYFCAVGPS